VRGARGEISAERDTPRVMRPRVSRMRALAQRGARERERCPRTPVHAPGSRARTRARGVARWCARARGATMSRIAETRGLARACAHGAWRSKAQRAAHRLRRLLQLLRVRLARHGVRKRVCGGRKVRRGGERSESSKDGGSKHFR
jgi:hypothetical protein